MEEWRGVSVYSGCRNRIPQPGWLKQQKSIFHSSGGWKSKIKIPAGFFSREASPPLSSACKKLPSCEVLRWPVLCAKAQGWLEDREREEREVLSGVLSHKDATAFGSGPHLYDLMRLYFPKDPISMNNNRLGLQHENSEGAHIQPAER